MADSLFTLVVCIVGIVPLVLVPFAEEPWLLMRHGLAYGAACHHANFWLADRPAKQVRAAAARAAAARAASAVNRAPLKWRASGATACMHGLSGVMIILTVLALRVASSA